MSSKSQSNNFLDCLNSIYNHEIVEIRLFIAFGITLAFAPISIGILYLIIFFVLFEMVVYWRSDNYPVIDRLAIISAAFLGWLVGRYIYEETRNEDYRQQLTDNTMSMVSYVT